MQQLFDETIGNLPRKRNGLLRHDHHRFTTRNRPDQRRMSELVGTIAAFYSISA